MTGEAQVERESRQIGFLLRQPFQSRAQTQPIAVLMNGQSRFLPENAREMKWIARLLKRRVLVVSDSGAVRNGRSNLGFSGEREANHFNGVGPGCGPLFRPISASSRF